MSVSQYENEAMPISTVDVEEKTINGIFTIDRIFYPKYTNCVEMGEYAIFSAIAVEDGENIERFYNYKFKGNVPALIPNTQYRIIAVLSETHPTYGDTYNIVYMTRSVDKLDRDSQMELLYTILPEQTVENIFAVYDDVIDILENGDVDALCKVKGIGESVAKRIIKAYDNVKDYTSAYIELGRMGFTGNLIKKITDHYMSPDIAIDVVLHHPYDLVEVDGIGFKKADEIALKSGVDKYSTDRIRGFMLYTLLEQGEVGKSYLHYTELMNILFDTLGVIPEEFINRAAKTMMDKNDVYVSEDGERIALKKFYDIEMSICNELDRLVKGKTSDKNNDCEYVPRDFEITNVEEIIQKVEDEQGFEFTDEQKNAIYTCLDNNVVAITGGAGVGKSSSAKGICSMFNGYCIVAVALSGKAAIRITEATGLEASTIHRALGWKEGKFIFNKNYKMSADIVLIDEATMMNGTLFKALLEAIPSGAKVIIMGDIQQLTPIGNCHVFADILNSGVLPTVRLTTPHRQALRSGIIPASIDVANQRQLFSSDYDKTEIIGELQDMELVITREKKDLSDTVLEKFMSEYKKVGDINEVQVITPMKLRGNLSCYNLNQKIQEYINPVSSNDNFITVRLQSAKNKDGLKEYRIKVGDKVINTKNNYRCLNDSNEITPVFNGNIGIVKSIGRNGMNIDFVGIGTVWFDRPAINNLELGYCITIHKSQGSGFKSVITAIDSSSFVLNNSELLYTAITRAKNYCILIGHNNAVRSTISKKEVSTKQTFLKEFLKKSAKQ